MDKLSEYLKGDAMEGKYNRFDITKLDDESYHDAELKLPNCGAFY